MKIVMIGDYSQIPYGGVQVHIASLVNQLSHIDNIDIHVITLGDKNVTLKKDALSIHVVKRPVPLPKIFTIPIDVYLLSRAVGKLNPDIVHVHGTYYPYSLFAASIAEKYPTLLTIHGLMQTEVHLTSFPYNLFKWMFCYLEKLALQRVKYVLVCSIAMKDVLSGMTNAKIYVNPNGIDLDGLQSIPAMAITHSSPSILFVGVLEKIKGVDVLLKALPLIKQTIPDIQLYILGKGSQETELKKMVRNLRLEDNVKFMGYVSGTKKFSFYKSVDLFVLPSVYETFGIVLLEAMACGKAIVASRVGGIPAIVDDGMTGLLFESGNENDLAKKVICLLQDTEQREKLGATGQERVGNFQWKNIAEKTVEIYRDILT